MDPIQKAIAELRAATSKPTAPAEPEPATPACCNGKRTGYQWHVRNDIPACAASKQAAADYSRAYFARTGGEAGRRRRRQAAASKRAA